MTLQGYTEMSSKTRWFPCVFKLVLAFLLFALTLTTVALYEAGSQRANTREVFLLNGLWNPFMPVNHTSDEVVATVERIARDATNGTKNYYEEQRAVVVNAESMEPVLAQRQDTFGPPVGRSDSFEENPYYDVSDDYGGEQQPADQEADRYYEGLAQESSESVSSESEQWPGSGPEGRAAHERPQDAFYSQWRYASKPPVHPSTNMHNRKLEPVAAPHSANRVPYQGYDDLYDYPVEGYRPQPQPQRDVIKPVSPANNNALANGGEGESTLVMVLRSLKQMWDLYQALASAWGAIHDHHQQSVQQQKKEQAERQRLREQQKKPRINSKKPPRIEGNKLAQRNPTKKNKVNGSITTTPVTSSTTAIPTSDSPSTEVAPTKVVQDKGSKGDNAQENEARGLREKRAPEAAATDVGEGRYIKGDPLTGYYDFVITEGSYKFWAAFQDYPADQPGVLTAQKVQELGTVENAQKAHRRYQEIQNQSILRQMAVTHRQRIEMEARCMWPQPRVIYITNETSKVYSPRATVLHRCDESTGCCANILETCTVKTMEYVDLAFWESSYLRNRNQMRPVLLQMLNHTECHCVNLNAERRKRSFQALAAASALSSQCQCPRHFASFSWESSGVAASTHCRCDCHLSDLTCQRLKNGDEGFAVSDRRCISSGDCSPPICAYGFYSQHSGRCPRSDQQHQQQLSDYSGQGSQRIHHGFG